MAASQQQQQHPQPQPQSPAQHGDVQTPGSSVAGPTQPLDSQASLPEDASQKLTGQEPHGPTPNQDAASEDGQLDPTPTTQATGQAHPAVSNSTMDTTASDGVQTLSEAELARIAREWQAFGKPSCPSCNKKHPPPCNPVRLAELAAIRVLKDKDPEAYQAQMAAFQAKYHKNQDTQPAQKRKAPSSHEAVAGSPPAKKGRKEERSKRSRGLHLPWCKSCQEFHLFGKHTKTKQEAQDLLNQQLYGLAPRPQLAAMQAAMDERRMIMTADANRGQLSAQEAQASLDRRVEAQRDREMAFIEQQAPAMFAHMIQQQGPEAANSFLVGLYNGTVARFPSQLQYPMPAYGHQAQPQQPMPAYGYPAPTYGYPASAFPTAQNHGLKAAEMQDTAPQPPMPYSGTAHGVPPGTRYDATPSRVPQQAAKAAARTHRDATEPRQARDPKDKARRPDDNTAKAKPKKAPQSSGQTPKESFRKGPHYSLNSSGPIRRQPHGVEHLLPDSHSHSDEASDEGVVLE